MWFIYFHEDTWQCGWSVSSEAEAVKYCNEHPDYCYEYVQNY